MHGMAITGATVLSCLLLLTTKLVYVHRAGLFALAIYHRRQDASQHSWYVARVGNSEGPAWELFRYPSSWR
jgi:hypothetical protein